MTIAVSRQLKQKGYRYWLGTGLALMLGLGASQVADRNQWFMGTRYRLYQFVQDLNPRKFDPRSTTLVVIHDDVYWKNPDLQGRVPINRRFLAHLLREINQLSPSVVALDFDLRSPFPDGSIKVEQALESETAELISEVGVVAKDRPLVLSQVIRLGSSPGYYALESNIYDDADFGTGAHNVYCGYIALAPDVRRVPSP